MSSDSAKRASVPEACKGTATSTKCACVKERSHTYQPLTSGGKALEPRSSEARIRAKALAYAGHVPGAPRTRHTWAKRCRRHRSTKHPERLGSRRDGAKRKTPGQQEKIACVLAFSSTAYGESFGLEHGRRRSATRGDKATAPDFRVLHERMSWTMDGDGQRLAVTRR